ncbi:MAG: hypothetical protein KJO07_08255 [Deltaproteobacteria bacterium]|jgi:hypothetical protein|nr:hypothetical protein [Deltaproteobacteria bacterium]
MVTLERAREHAFMAGVGDVGMQLCEANVPYGLAKIHHVQEQLGLPADATFVGSPDATVTRNDRRWSQGFGYGGVYSWSGEFAVLDMKPNACGMLVGALPDLPGLEQVRERLHALDREGIELDGVALDNDLTESNHFVDVLTVNDDKSTRAAPGGARHFFIMHSSGHEHRGETPRGPGLYFDQSKALAEMARVFETPWGSLSILEGDDAREWFRFYQEVQDFNHRRREALAGFLFDEFTPVVNATHQGLVRGLTRANIGCYTFDDGDQTLFPLTLSPTLPAFLVEPHDNVSQQVIRDLGWAPRIDEHDLYDRIRGTNLLPHGGGYLYPQLKGVTRVIEDGPDQRRFELRPTDPASKPVVIETPRGLDYGYRGMEVKDCMEELGLGTAVVQLDLDYVLKA